ncbi:MAG: phosphoribosylamine--glycine ligase, partial [Campylobacteraceae bacterium]|nr:phosphoribosylamine--glycine ligase [Campylobacteraceae bacterium]MBT7273680.1 phosphoribosylamine--glycine ligase [Campylobacteraceae bacterium]
MNILILGSGGREYSIGLAISKEQEQHNITFCPGNGATDNIGSNINIKDYNELAVWAKENEIDLTIVGPEAPLVDGVVDIFKENGLTIFGPSAKAAQLEGSKVYMKNILKKYNIPTAAFVETSSQEEANNFIDLQTTLPIVVKAD